MLQANIIDYGIRYIITKLGTKSGNKIWKFNALTPGFVPDLSKVSKYILRAGSNSPDTQSREQRAWKDHHEYHGRIFPKNWFNCFLSFSKEAINSHFTFQSKDPQESPI